MFRLKFIALSLILVPFEIFSVNSSWTGQDGNNWSTVGNWSPPQVPNGVGSEADLGSAVTAANPTVTLDIPVTLTTLTIDHGGNYTVNSSNINSNFFTFQTSGMGGSQINIENANGNGAHTISANITITDPFAINQYSTQPLTISGNISGNGDFAINPPAISPPSPTGTVVLTGDNSGFTGTLLLADSTLVISPSGSGSDAALGNNSASFSFVSETQTTLQITGNINSSRSFGIEGPGQSIIDTQDHTFNLTGPVRVDDPAIVVGPFVKKGNGTLLLSDSSNNFNGGFWIEEGTLQIAQDSCLGASNSPLIIYDGAKLQFINNNPLTRNVSIAGISTIDTQGNTNSLAGQISGNGMLTKIGSGSLTLSSGNTYIGGTTISQGTVQINASSCLGFATSTVTIKNGTLHFLAEFPLTQSLEIDGDDNSPSYINTDSYTIEFSETPNGSGTLGKTGSGTLKLSSSSPWTNKTILDAGTLLVTTSSLQGDVVSTGGATLSFVQSTDGTFPGNLSGSGAMIKSGNGTLTLTGTNSYTGGTTVSAGVLEGDSSSLTGSFAVSSGTSLNFNQTSNGTFGGSVTGDGQLIKEGLGALILSGQNSYKGGTTLSAGTLQGDTSSLQGSFSTSSNTTLSFHQTSSGTFAGNISGSGAFEKAGAGTLILSGANSYSGGSTVTAGTLQISTTSLSGNIEVKTGAILSFDQSTSGSFSSVISGAGQVQKTGAGVLTLTASNNNYQGGTTIQAGTLQISNDGNLGAPSSTLTIANGAMLQFGSGFSMSRPITLQGSATIDTQEYTSTLSQKVSGASGALNKIGSGTLLLVSNNTYGGGTVVSEGTLTIAADSALGASSATLTIGTATLKTAGPITSQRTISLTGSPSVFDTWIYTDTLTGMLTGSGLLEKAGSGTLILAGTNSYSGTTTVSAGTLQGTTNALPGDITINGGATLSFNQSFNGSYGGIFDGTGVVSIDGTGIVTFTGDNSSFIGATKVNSGTLNVNGSLSSSPLTVAKGATLGGNGTVGPLTSNGTISPGNSIGTITVDGNLTLQPDSLLAIELTPTTIDFVSVTGTAALNGTVQIIGDNSYFYGSKVTQTFLSSAGLNGTTFTGVTTADSNFQPTLNYTSSGVAVFVRVIRPFLYFPYSGENPRSVGRNMDDLSASSSLSDDLTNVIDSFVGLDTATINNALDQMHPAQYSALFELQNETGSRLLSLFHRKPYTECTNGCGSSRVWAEPFGNWMEMNPHGEQIGLSADSAGVAIGFDQEISDRFSLGIGGVYQYSDLHWHNQRGHAISNTYYGALYGDYSADSYALGFSLLAGQDFYETTRHLEFTSYNRHAHADYNSFNLASQLNFAYFFGTPAAYLFPYANLDYFYQSAGSIEEKGAGGLNLKVEKNTRQSLRSEMGIGFTVTDRNYDETISISPLVSLGWAMVSPLSRPHYQSTFEGASTPFSVKGWDQTWNMLTADFGLNFCFDNVSFELEYHVELTPDHHTTLFNQIGNARLGWKW
jgi:outer membrane autotransporter protein